MFRYADGHTVVVDMVDSLEAAAKDSTSCVSNEVRTSTRCFIPNLTVPGGDQDTTQA